jgi:hypothetical protein
MSMVPKNILLGNGDVKPEKWQTINERGAFPVIIGARYGTSPELVHTVGTRFLPE